MKKLSINIHSGEMNDNGEIFADMWGMNNPVVGSSSFLTQAKCIKDRGSHQTILRRTKLTTRTFPRNSTLIVSNMPYLSFL